jgi:hypothetical protein
VGAGELGLADQEGQATFGGYQAGGDRERSVEVLYCAEGYCFGGWVWVGFGAGGEYIDLCQCKGSGELAEEGGFLLVGFDQG